MHNLRAIDLNLLVILDALLTEKHISRAAISLNMSQPAVSHALSKLRQLFNDPLLIKQHQVLVLSATAQELVEPVHQLIDNIQSLITLPIFEPANAKDTFKIALSDYGCALLTPSLIRELHQQAPNIKVVMMQSSREVMIRQLISGEIDFALGVFDYLPHDIYSMELFKEKFICVADKKHPSGLTLPNSLAEYLQQRHVLAGVQGEPIGEVEEALAKLGKKRDIAVIIPHFLLAPSFIVGNQLVLTIASRVVNNNCEEMLIFNPPFDIPPFNFLLAWHKRNHKKQRYQWFKQLLIENLSEQVDKNTTG